MPLSFWFDHFLDSRAEIHQMFGWVFGKFNNQIFILRLTDLQSLAFFDYLPLCDDIFYLLNVDKRSTFLNYIPTHILNVVCERPFVFILILYKAVVLMMISNNSIVIKVSVGIHKWTFVNEKSNNKWEVDKYYIEKFAN